MAADQFAFDFERGSGERQELLAQAEQTVGALATELGDTDADGGETATATKNLLRQLNEDVVEFGAYPEVVQLRAKHFSERGLTTPPQFVEQSKTHRFYWLRLPLTLSTVANLPFDKLECAVEFNPGATEGHLRPVAHLILPDRKFKDLVAANATLQLSIGPDFEFAAGIEPVSVDLPGVGHAKAGGSVDAKAAANLGFVAGPFSYRIKKAQLTHSPAGTEKVFWKIDGTEFVRDDDPTFIVILKVPKPVEHVNVAAALQAYHDVSLIGAGIGGALYFFKERIARFFRAGAPVPAEGAWDITPSL